MQHLKVVSITKSVHIYVFLPRISLLKYIKAMSNFTGKGVSPEPKRKLTKRASRQNNFLFRKSKIM
jgi:hypothetical protein